MPTLNNLKQISSQEILKIIQRAINFKNLPIQDRPLKEKKIISTLFLEPSTRTLISFQLAVQKLGHHLLPFSVDQSSFTKGEDLLETLFTLEAMGVDICIIRLKDENKLEKLSNQLKKMRLISAGEGTSSHPTQALLDAMTIYEEFNKLDHISLAIAGDIKHSRVASSHRELWQKFTNAQLSFCGPDFFMPDGVHQSQIINIDQACQKVMVLMLLRNQQERHPSEIQKKIGLNTFLADYGLTKNRYKMLSDQTIILHPGPHHVNVEIDETLVDANKSRIRKQVENGVFMRMSIIEWALSGEKK